MSRIGKHPVMVPAGVQVTLDGNTVRAKGKLGELSTVLPPEVDIKLEGDKIVVAPASGEQRARAMWGLSRSIVSNVVRGVSSGFSRKLEISGVGYRASTDGKILTLQLGYSHEIKYAMPADVKVVCETPTQIVLSGADPQKIGQIASELRGFRKPEPYKGKGVKYAEERVRRKEGKKK